MLWSQLSAIFANFRRKNGGFQKTNVMIQILLKNANLFAENIFKIITSVPGHAAADDQPHLLQDSSDVFRCAASVAPVVDWRLYDAYYAVSTVPWWDSNPELRFLRRRRWLVCHATKSPYYYHKLQRHRCKNLPTSQIKAQSDFRIWIIFPYCKNALGYYNAGGRLKFRSHWIAPGPLDVICTYIQIHM
jgi:hypothetical protein